MHTALFPIYFADISFAFSPLVHLSLVGGSSTILVGAVFCVLKGNLLHFRRELRTFKIHPLNQSSDFL